MKACPLKAVAGIVALMLVVVQGASEFEACKSQATFDVRMCKSHMCTDCTLAWCMESCQKLQEEHSSCRCMDWPEARKSYSGDGMKGAGKYGDIGDSQAARLGSSLLWPPPPSLLHLQAQVLTMKAAAAALLASVLLSGVSANFEACKSQATFDVRMCKSHMCGDCTLAWCMESCQKLQEEHSGCRCEDWPEARVSYSGEGMKGAGKYGDVGDYSK
eukprot:CAMPEP_0177460512 /NCGR_PEP_ID=MMETSP0369-20130122/14703_1 /TAXON_ID=447022 ORGANISM="Scrippsiella hangoei-like, Strain SHHI-4" /NCGR_SAMPLE_ID=MMETSP0369 /ASSEMBLY_ACC=CAM_ASM_000364 /LENGTH=215 /DNA_ID=CAMNT_0018933901 /DNA_START=84 /DNA_END=732 /DNA_ORIENTATION=-